jgi:thiamine-monophosphate kinase
MDSKRTEIKQLGEFGLIERLVKPFKHSQPTTYKSIGDDAAVLDFGENYQVITTDLLTEGIHFDLTYMPLRHLGYKSVVVNVSDVAAMNARPTQILVSIGISNRFSVEAVEEIYAGIASACEHYKVDLVGGDTTSSASGLIISITAIGEVEKDKVSFRKGAKVNDIVCVTGDLGAAYMGLQVLNREKEEFLANPDMQPKLEDYEYIVQRQLKPDARTDIVYELNDLGLVPSAMIDISDGLASELFHIGKNSGTGVNIFEDKLPLDRRTYEAAVEFKLDPVTCMLNGGEDYELLFTINQKDFEKIKNHADIHFIGYVTEKEKGLNLVTKQENVVPIQAQGWEHF